MRQPYFGIKVALLTNIYFKKNKNKACIKNEEKQQVHASF